MQPEAITTLQLSLLSSLLIISSLWAVVNVMHFLLPAVRYLLNLGVWSHYTSLKGSVKSK